MNLLLAFALIVVPLSSPVARGVPADPVPRVPTLVAPTLADRTAVVPVVRLTAGPSRSFGWPWDQLAQCESGGRWHISHGSFRGGLQFLTSTWLWMGGGEFAPEAHLATPAQQVTVADRLVAHERSQGRGGWNPWPACADRLGLPR